MTTTVPSRAARLLPPPGAGRPLAVISLLGSVGLGLYQAGSVLYFSRFAGLSLTTVGTGLSVAGLVGLAAGVVVGRLADRLGARRVAVAAALAKTVPLAFAPWAHGFWAFLSIVTVLGLAESAWVVANEAIIAHAVGGGSRVRLAALLRSVFNIGLTAGTLLASIALAVGSETAYLVLFGSYAAAALAEALICLRVPRVPPREPAPGRPRTGRALRDLPYMAVAFHSNLTTLGDAILVVGLPLWIVEGTDAPTAVAAWLIALNTVIVVFLQMWAAKKAETVSAAIGVQRWGLLAFTGCCALIALSGAAGAWPAVALLALGVVALSAGEIWGQAARWSLRFSLAPADAQGEYGATFRLGLILPRVLGPLLVTTVIAMDVAGWLLLGLVFALGIALNRPVCAWAVRTRPAESPS